jgi:hypothetical protein
MKSLVQRHERVTTITAVSEQGLDNCCHMKAKIYVRWLGAGIALAATLYASYVGITWCRYGRAKLSSDPKDQDSRLDELMPVYQVVERRRVCVAAPVETTFAAACDMNLQDSVIVHAIFRTRELLLGSQREKKVYPLRLVDQAKAWGWGVLADDPGHEIVFGAATQPWLPNPVFRTLSRDEFVNFQEPGYVKIAWTLRADPYNSARSVARTETRVATTDPDARAKFRRYWALLSPGIILIRRLSLNLVREEAERRARIRISARKEQG